jgi:5'-3' exonuclease
MPEAYQIPDDAEITLLIDGDTIAFRAAASCQHNLEDEDGWVMPFANVHEGEAKVDNLIMGVFRDLGATHLQVYLSDPEVNWRKEMWDGYKANRKDSVRPMLLARLKEYLRVKYGATHWAGLEADDVLGILATAAKEFDGLAIIVGKDKDFHTFPALHHQLGDRGASGKPLVRKISEQYAEWFHLVQTLAGDAVDGYPGCPGIGMARAREIMADPHILIPESTTVTRGPRKGQSTTKWSKTPANGNLWAVVVSHYQKAGKTEKDALLTARLAHILQAGDYDRETGAITLWTPPKSITLPRGEKPS